MAGQIFRGRLNPFSRMRHYLLVRDPYQRLESFFKDKFRQEPALKLNENDQVQRCQRMFFPYLAINPDEPPPLIRRNLLKVPFDQFIAFLPHVYQLDGHLVPQVRTTKIHLRKRAKFPFLIRKLSEIPIPFRKILKLESADDLAFLQNELSIDLSKKHNNTDKIKLPNPWTPELRAVVNNLYRADFQTFDYDLVLSQK